jgi:small GTP-binding protein
MTDFEVPSYKVVVIGNSGCGKTALITRWVTGSFDPTTASTIGTTHERKRVTLADANIVELCVWDTAGQEQYQSLVPLFLRSASIAIVVTSVVDAASFTSIPSWIDTVTIACQPRPPLILAVSKMDLCENPASMFETIHQSWDPMFSHIFFISAVTGESIIDLFHTVAVEAFRFTPSLVPILLRPVEAEKQSSRCC